MSDFCRKGVDPLRSPGAVQRGSPESDPSCRRRERECAQRLVQLRLSEFLCFWGTGEPQRTKILNIPRYPELLLLIILKIQKKSTDPAQQNRGEEAAALVSPGDLVMV